MTDRLSLYNKACQLAGERFLTSLTEEVEVRRLLDNVWSTGGVDECLSEGQWIFAMRTVQIDYDPSVTPTFGYTYAFQKPTDWILTSAVCTDEFYRVPLTRYADEVDYIYSDLETIYVRYVSNDVGYGGNLGKWPAPFTEFAAAHFATNIILKLSDNDARWNLFVNPQNPERTIRGRALLKAKSRNMMANPTQFDAQGNWTKARQRGVNRRDGGSNNSLLG